MFELFEELKKRNRDKEVLFGRLISWVKGEEQYWLSKNNRDMVIAVQRDGDALIHIFEEAFEKGGMNNVIQLFNRLDGYARSKAIALSEDFLNLVRN